MGFSANNLSFSYTGRDKSICENFSLAAEDGTIVAILGRNGVGKTTLLRLLAGLERPSAEGKIEIKRGEHSMLADDRTWSEILPKHVSLVFQEYGKAVFEWQTVEKALRWIRPEVDDYYSNVVSLFPNLTLPVSQQKYWGQLSGGQKQALALARALLRDPDVLLLDEPCACIDAFFRYALEEALVKIHAMDTGRNRVMVLVTHDIDEAVFMANRVVLVSGAPLEVVTDVRVTTPLLQRERTFRLSDEFMAKRKEVFEKFFELPVPSA